MLRPVPVQPLFWLTGRKSQTALQGRKEENNSGATVEELVEEAKKFDENVENWSNAMVGEFLHDVFDSEEED